MEDKNEIVEKRVTKTVIRRRTQVVKVEPEKKPEEVAKETPAAEAASSAAKNIPATRVATSTGATPAIAPKFGSPIKAPMSEEDLEKEKERLLKKPIRKRSKAELDMEMIKRAGGLKKVALTTGDAEAEGPEPLDRIFQPTRSFRKKKLVTRKELRKTSITIPKATKRIVKVENEITVGDFARRMGIKASAVIKKLLDLGVEAEITKRIDLDTATLVAHEFNYEVESIAFKEDEALGGKKDEADNLKTRPPVVTVMGHVDHGKTSILDVIRKTNVTAGEAGGITQHIGAYEVVIPKGKITFIDTPGHEAFTAMRARGAKATDIVVLVVAADDGVMPQTIEAINHAKAAGVTIIVAVNKMDKPEADLDKVRRGLSNHGLLSEDWGGETIMVPVSAKTKEGIDKLLEMILLQAEMMDLKANPSRSGIGIVAEAKLDKGRGPVATVLVRNGTIKQGEFLVVGTCYGKIRALVNDQGKNVKEAGPSVPVEVLGLSGVPQAGDSVNVVDSEETARSIVEHRLIGSKVEGDEAPKATLESLFAGAAADEIKELRIVLKTDVHGSLEAVQGIIGRITSEKVKVTVIHAGVGSVTESDVMLAEASNAVVIGFNIRPDTNARKLAESSKIDVRCYKIIYELEDEIKKALKGMLKPEFKETYVGRAEVRQVFAVSKIGKIAGSVVVDGKIERKANVRLLRNGKIIYDGKLASLKRFKDDAKEATSGVECGIGIEGYSDLKEGDVIEAYRAEELEAEL